MLIRLSHTLNRGGPAFGRVSDLSLDQRASIARGDSHHGFMMHIYNHDGTHLDAPYHFNIEGRRVADLDVNELVFERPQVIDTPKSEAALITPDDLEPYADAISQCDLLMLRTGYCRIRASDPHKYSYECPCIAPATSRLIIEDYSNIRAVAIDAVSVGSPAFPEETVETHRILTGHRDYSRRYVLIFEDVNMDFDLSGIRRVFAMPLFIEQIDGSPCTMIAEL